MKHLLKFALSAIALSLILTFLFIQKSETVPRKYSKQERIEAALDYNFKLTKDPELGYPPVDRLLKAVEQTRKMQQEFSSVKNNLIKARFKERGPDNIGGRTRAILIDAKDPERKKIWAGGVAGGLWKTNDITASNPNWQKVDDYLENLAVGALVQDPNDSDVMYMGTGEGFPNADAVAGVGIFRSLDNGETWQLLPATANGDFRVTRKMLVHPSGDVYAAATRGLFRSKDQGETWEKVLGSGLFAVDNMYDIFHVAANDYIYVSTANSIYKSQTGDPRDWEDLATPFNLFPRGFSRIEFAISPSNPDIIYLVGSQNGSGTNVYKTIDGSESWQDMGAVRTEGDFTNGQAWYDLEIAVDPFDPNHVIVGGVPIYRSTDGAQSFERFAFNMHVDQHLTVFDKEQEGLIYFGNDGGVYRSVNGSSASVPNRNLGYNITQFYACAFHPDAFSDYILGGTQDNNSLQMNGTGIAAARPVLGGDGMLCHIDQEKPENQIVSWQFGNYYLSTDGGKSFNIGPSVQGSFVNPSDFDEDSKIMYFQTFNGDYGRWNISDGNNGINMDIKNLDLDVSFVYVDPSTENRIYLGTFGSGVYQVDNAHRGRIVSAKRLGAPGVGAVSSININPNNPNHILISYSNYGLRNNVYESKNGGNSFVGIEGNLPDMPVRSVLINPENPQQAVIATEAGVWFTDKMDGENTIWLPPAIDRGTPIVRTDMLQYRASDKQILAATHGRGMFVSDVFSAPKALFTFDQIGYTDAPMNFSGLASLGAESFLWNLGDGTEINEETINHSYSNYGEYDVEFTINGDLTENATVKVLPDRNLPYISDAKEYSGGFEQRPEDYGVATLSGSAFELGSSTFTGKDGTYGGANAFVIAKDSQFYEANTHTMLYLPNFNFSEKGIYEFSFWSKQFIQDGSDGFLVEYSTDRGRTWQVLGTEQENWYDFTNGSNENAAFEVGTSFFGRSSSSFQEHFLDVSQLSGEENVAFRFVFRSNATGSHPGLVIDNVEITKYEGALETDIVNLEADYVDSETVGVVWTTQPEYFAQKFVLERSFNGKDFEEIEKLEPRGITSSRVYNYNVNTLGTRDLYFFRIRSINENKDDNYFYEFTTPTIVVRRSKEPVGLYRTFPNPFKQFIDLTFDGFVNQEVSFELYDATGRLVYQQEQVVDDIYLRLEVNQLPAGIYFLRYKIGEQAARTERLVRAD
ncbi:MAG: T9SS type A sorting domain-containing protein [Bacteroidota bacterium]